MTDGLLRAIIFHMEVIRATVWTAKVLSLRARNEEFKGVGMFHAGIDGHLAR
jgi:hypothetical protein